jgi:hypothetical protein
VPEQLFGDGGRQEPVSKRVRRLHARALAQVEELVALAGLPEEELLRHVEKVSRWSVGEHLAHLVLVDRSILERLERTARGLSGTGSFRLSSTGALKVGTGSGAIRMDGRMEGRLPEGAGSAAPAAPAGRADRPEKIPTRRVSLIGRLVLWLGFIPRGKGRAPDPFRPESVSAEALQRDLADVRQRLAALAASLGVIQRSDASFRHFIFGELMPAEWLRFLGIHHHHHLKIIRDLRRAAGRA